MELIRKSVTDYVKNREYYRDARNWYHKKYLFPIFEWSLLGIVIIFTLFICCGLALNVYYLFPLKIRREYLTYLDEGLDKAPIIIKADSQKTELESITALLIKNYVKQREKYNYDNIKQQLLYIKNNSSRLLFKEFYDGLSLANPNSMILKFKKDAKRTILSKAVKFTNNNMVTVTFSSKAENLRGELVEDAEWEAVISFESDKINPQAVPGTRFGFIVTDYKVKLVKNNLEQKANK